MPNPHLQSDGNKMEKILKGSKHGAFIQFHTIAIGEKEKDHNIITKQNLINLIKSFQHLFKGITTITGS